MSDKKVFVFGSNLAGFHGAGAAKFAEQHHGARHRIGFGYCENSIGASFAIPTKDCNIRTLSLDIIEHYVKHFMHFSYTHPEWLFYITAIGTGLAKYSHSDIAPMFKSALSFNCEFPIEWKLFLGEDRKYYEWKG